MARNLDRKSKDCRDSQLIGSYCGCPAIQEACEFCPGETVANPDRLHVRTYEPIGYNVTCTQLEEGLLQVEEDSDLCFLARFSNWECGCNDGFYSYMGTKSHRDQRLLSILPKISGSLSVIGCLFIFQDYWRGDRGNIYRQIMCLMSLFDVITALSWMLGSVAIPAMIFSGTIRIYMVPRGTMPLALHKV